MSESLIRSGFFAFFALACFFALPDFGRGSDFVDESPGVIETFKKDGKHVYLVSGDNDATSRQVGRECGI